MIEKLFNEAHLLHQSPDNDCDLAEHPIAFSIDNGNSIIVSQENRKLCINAASVPKFCKLLKQMVVIKKQREKKK